MSRLERANREDSEREGRETTVAQIVRSLEFDILFGALRPRERLVEDALMARFSAKRHAVRQALVKLEHMGIVVRTPNRGASVRDFTTEEVEDLAEVRETLHSRAVQRMPLPAPPELVATLTAIQEQHDRAVAARDPRRIDDANEAFHRTMFEACGNKILSDAIAHYAYLSRAMRLYPLVDSKLLETLRHEHWAMIDALTRGDRRELARLIRGHIQHSKNLYLRVRGGLSRWLRAHSPSARSS